METAERWIARGEALERLGVKTQTLYAYVSRGRIAARPDPANPRRSLYAVEDILRLSGGSDPAASIGVAHVLPFEMPPARGEALIQSSLTLIADGRMFYRGLDVDQLSQTATFEEVARLLWDARETNPFAGLGPRIDSAGGISARARMFAALARRAEEDASSLGRTVTMLKAEAASVLNEVIDAVAGTGPRLHFHQRLGRGWKVLERDGHLLRRALVLAADHDLDPAVLATRAAAGGGASPAGAALGGLATLAALPQARQMTRIIAYVIEARRDPAGAAGRRIAVGEGIPGFALESWLRDGQADPRATALLDAADLPADLAAVVREGEAASGLRAGFGLALAVVARRLDLPRDGALDLLLVGRLAGLLGHALDQLTDGSPIAARLRYVGPRPGAH